MKRRRAHFIQMGVKYRNQRGLTLIELLISIAIVGIMATGIFSFMSSVYQNQIKSYQLAQRTEQALIMKAALDNSVTNAGSIAAPTLSSGGGYTNGSTPFNIFGAIGNFLYGNCPAQGLFGNIYGFLNTTTNTIFNDLFFGGYNSQHTTATNGDSNLISVPIPTTPVAATSSSLSFYWLVVHTSGGDELCQGNLQINADTLTYTVTGSATSGHSDCGAPNGSNNATTDYPIGPGWRFLSNSQTGGYVWPDAQCLGAAYPNSIPAAIVAQDASANGLSATEVTVCLPAM